MDAITVLVVDDEPGIAMLCNRLLTRAGFSVTYLTDSRQALGFLENNSVDLLLVDIRMPEVDGFEVIAHARRFQPDIAVLVMTGYGTVETAIRALRQGVDGLILKPFDRGNELIEAVQQALVDNQQKQDASRTRALRPLFSVTESLLSETQRDRLLDLITSAICGYLRCAHAGYFLAELNDNLALQAERGKALSDSLKDILVQVDTIGTPLLIHASGPGRSEFRDRIAEFGFGSAIFVPVSRPEFRSVLYAARDPQETQFRESDFEMFQILARQAAAAVENSRLYAKQLEYVRTIEESQKALLQSEKMAAAGRLSASIAHEVNNPLQAVQNCLHLAGREEFSPEKRKEYFDLAQIELERLMVTVRRMLDFYRPGTAVKEKANLTNILQHVLTLMDKQLSEGGVEVVLNMPENLPKVEIVSSQIQQVFLNLILNSYDAMSGGGRLEISGHTTRGGVEVIFQDTGPGIPVDKQVNIFEPFFSTKEGGTGLGLTVSYNILTAQGGLLEFLPENGPGACFRVFIPTGGKR
ncbi:MAG TPA: response regulator [Anaerolineales bacterium]|nr:response regulator [Anaerolineales bacterium]